jgi:FMN phosphatase YigB (HAD superfamily)
MIKAVVFDLDGVYFEGGTERFIENMKVKYGLSSGDVIQVYLKSEEMQKYKRGKIDDEAFWNYAINAWKIDAARKELVDLLISGYELNPNTALIVKKLRNKNIKTAICTNNFPDRLENLKAKFELGNNFDVIVTSYEEGITKPSEEIFNLLASKLGLNSAEIYF